MTDVAHLETIEKHGLLSARRAYALGIVPRFPGGSGLTQSLDADRGLNDMVFLSFYNLGIMPNHDDARKRRPVLLKIDPSVLMWPGVRVALGRANRSRTMICKPARAFYEMDWEVILGDVDSSQIEGRMRVLEARDYEVLVPDRVPVEYIIGIA
ncbi:DUF4433 domain-containing protein [Pararhizobium sp. BT-229]|uniref:DUF4433 domain-containing protein n=1 Tax=Pararhizobium sp. BT-229 TaxID=2986923 RepID=UPI0021F75721|nr:DUF4433 domain-containing protein [Pararhizobium sp. BT-229]MCV9964487.1 DUF4433 domain-containing protein [Pararhizobium sp. BT-229]